MSAAFWVVGAFLLLALEILVPAFFFGWFGLGALLAGLASALGLGALAPQLILFATSSTALVIGSRTILRPLLRSSPQGAQVRLNAAALPGQAATVVQAIDNRREQGQVMLHGMEWTARSLDEERIPEGARVRVIRVEGVKLIVEPED